MTAARRVVLIRRALAPVEEVAAAEEVFERCLHARVAFSRRACAGADLVIGRYSVLPYYAEVEADVAPARLIHSRRTHEILADAMEWAPLLGDLTPPVFPEYTPDLEEGAYVVKGRTNSRKNRWDTHMFATSRDDIRRVARNLHLDPYIDEQGLVVRPYVPLRSFGVGIGGVPVANEWRTFWWILPAGQTESLGYQNGWSLVHLGSGWYWTNHPEAQPSPTPPPEVFATSLEAAQRLAEGGVFGLVAVDVAERADGEWIVVEVNDGQMSGLCGLDAVGFYTRLKAALGVW